MGILIMSRISIHMPNQFNNNHNRLNIKTQIHIIQVNKIPIVSLTHLINQLDKTLFSLKPNQSIKILMLKHNHTPRAFLYKINIINIMNLKS